MNGSPERHAAVGALDGLRIDSLCRVAGPDGAVLVVPGQPLQVVFDRRRTLPWFRAEGTGAS